MTQKFYTSAIQWGNNILYRGVENGQRVQLKIPFKPTLFADSPKQTEFKTLWGKYVAPITFDSIKEAKEYTTLYEDVRGFNIHGMTNYQYQFIADKFVGDIEYDLNLLNIYSLDIETTTELGFPDYRNPQEEILLISVHNKATKENIVWGSRSYTALPDDIFTYRMCKDENTLLREFVSWWHNNCPDVVTGWHIDGFDIPYLIHRISKTIGEEHVNKLSPWGNVSCREVTKFDQQNEVWDIQGVTILDYIDLYKKFTYGNRESYKLGYIAQEELGESKHELEGSFKDQYTNQWPDFVRYNAQDSRLVDLLDDKLKFIELVFTIAYLAKCNLKDVYGPVKTWDVFIYNYLKAKNIVIPPQSRKHGGEFEGAWVKEPQIGMHGWTMSFDFASLYPSIIRQWNMSPETFVGMKPGMTVDLFMNNEFDHPDTDDTVAANGAMFSKEVYGIVPEVVKVILDGRKIAKKDMLKLEQEYQDTKDKTLEGKIASLDGKQMAFKILANSLYGALSNAGFRYFDLRLAEAITLTGQASDRHIERILNVYMNNLLKTENKDYVIAGDTDSIYLNVDPLVRKVYGSSDKIDKSQIVTFLDSVGNSKFKEQIDNSIAAIYKIGNCYEKVMDMKREAIASKVIWTAKKRYAMMVHNSEGVTYTPYKMKIMGMDLIKSSTPQLIRKKLKEALVIIFEKDEPALHKYVSDLRLEFNKMSVEEISFPRGANDIEKWADERTKYKSRTPIHVRGAIMYNWFFKNDNEIVDIKGGDKVKFVYLKMPNPIKEDVISFPSFNKLPKQMGLHNYINWDLQWEKTFINPILGITKVIGWHPELQPTLEGILF